MLATPRTEPQELKILRYLNCRMALPQAEANYYWRLEKGFEGEKIFDALLEEKLQGQFLNVPNLFYEINGSQTQIDSFVITQATHYHFEVKNLEGDYFIKDGKWYQASNNKEISDPVLQAQRAASVLRRLLQNLGYQTPFKSIVVFVNPNFHLYHSSQQLPIIFPTQINRFIQNMDLGASQISQYNQKLAEKMIAAQDKPSFLKKMPAYTFHDLKKGEFCPLCFAEMIRLSKKMMGCEHCGHTEPVSSTILRSVDEISVLFPEMKITVNGIAEWCPDFNKKTIWKTLSNNFSYIPHGKTSYYMQK